MISTQVLGRLDCLRSNVNLREVSPIKVSVNIISSPIEIIDIFGIATIILPNDTILHLENALSNRRSKRNLFSFKMYAIMDTIFKH